MADLDALRDLRERTAVKLETAKEQESSLSGLAAQAALRVDDLEQQLTGLDADIAEAEAEQAEPDPDGEPDEPAPSEG